MVQLILLLLALTLLLMMRLMLNGNHAAQVTRTVNVVDSNGPIITLRGSTPVTVEVGSVYVDAGATAFDNYDGVLDWVDCYG